MNKTENRLKVAVALAAIALAPDVAHAQAAGGGTFLQGALTWLQGNVITTLSTIAVIIIGIMLMAMRFSLVSAFCICAGIWIVFNATTLSGLLHT